MCAAYDGLSPALKEEIEDMRMVHDYMRAFGALVPPEREQEMRNKFPAQSHPVAGRHEKTGRRYLYVNRAFTERVDGRSRDESLPLIDHLSSQAALPEYQCRFHWTPDAIAIWDNRAVQHYAASDYWPDVRVMELSLIHISEPTRPY